MNLAFLSWKNLWAQPWTTLISLFLLILGVGTISLLLQLNEQLDDQFRKNIRGIDMVVGAKGSPLQLILASVYHIDNPTGNISLKEATALKENPLIETWIPLSYGDNYQGYRILGTEWSYVAHFEGKLRKGKAWEASFETVLGATVAERLGLAVGDSFFGAHGSVAEAEAHEEHPYLVVGILEKTETVLDQLILTSLESVWDIHNHEESEAVAVTQEHEEEDHDHPEGEVVDHDHDHDHEHDHDHAAGESHDHEDHTLEEDLEITSVLIKWKNPMAMMQLPRFINQETSMQAAVTAIEISRLFDLFSVGISTLRGIASAIVFISLISVFLSLYNSLRGRSYEIALMRTMGASREDLLAVILLEGLWLALVGAVVGLIVSRVGMYTLALLAEDAYRYELVWWRVLPEEVALFAITLLVGLTAATFPAISAYRTDISETLRGGGA